MSNRSKRFFLPFIICIAILAQGSASHAYYPTSLFSLGYYGSYFMWPASMLLSPLYYGSSYGLFGYNYRNNAYNNSYQNYPYNNSSYANAYGTIPNGNSNAGYYQPNNALNNYNSNVSQFGNQNQPSQLASANTPFASNSDVFNVNPQSGSPQLAPDRRSANSLSPSQINAAAYGFFQTVAAHYKGDLVQALSRSDMRSWADSIGLMEPGQAYPKNLSKSRKTEITAVVKDSSLEPYKKFDILRVLLK